MQEIAIVWRPPGEPHFGGHIERLIGTQMGKLHLLPGTTFSNTVERGEYDPRRHSALTLRELERYIALDIVVGVQISTAQVGVDQMGAAQVGGGQVGPAQVRAGQVGLWQLYRA